MVRGLLIALIVIVVLVGGVAAWAVSVNNQLVGLDQNVAEKWSQVQNVDERQRFNEAVREYNTRLRLFPGSLVAGFSGFQLKAFFEAAADAGTAPKVKF